MKPITLGKQEQPTEAKFNHKVVLTNGFIRTFHPVSELLAKKSLDKIIRERVNSKEGADYLQVVYYDNKKFWIIDDGYVVTCLLPEEY